MKIAINGFGRIGRSSLKIALENPLMEVVAINDLGEVENLAYLLKYDTAYGVYDKEIKVEDGMLIVSQKRIQIFREKDPAKLPWEQLGVDVVLECTGMFEDRAGASGHLKAGAKKVIISSPAKDKDIKAIVIGVNHTEVVPEDDILSNASCTTNCISPMAKVLEDNFGIEKSLMTTIHAYTATQGLVDGPADKKDLRRGRAAALNIVPATTGAAKTATLTLPSLKDKFDGMAFRVPVIVGSATDLVALLKRDVTEEEINEAFKKAASSEMRGIIEVTAEPLVSHDIVGNPHSVIVDLAWTKVIGGNLIKVVGWYDNEWGYSNRLVELAELTGGMIK